MPSSRLRAGAPLLMALAATTLSGTAAQAQTFYTSLTALNAAASTNVVQNFEGIAPAGSSSTSPSVAPLTITVINSSFNTNDYAVVDGASNGGIFSLNGTSSLRAGLAFNTNPTVTLNLGSTATAFGTEIGFRNTAGTSTETFTAKLFNGATQVGTAFSSASLSTGYFGVTSTLPFDNVQITTTTSGGDGPYQIYDNVRDNAVSAAAGAPEPGSLTLFALAGAGPLTALVARRRKGRN